MKFHYLSILCLAAISSFAAPSAPKILAQHVTGTNLLVTVTFPKGWQAVVLESRGQGDAGAYALRAVSHSALNGKASFKLAASLKGQSFRVRGELHEPLPKSFYRGKHSFAGRHSTFWRPDQGRGEAFAISANAALPANGGSPIAATTTRTVTESDIWKISGDTLYLFNQLRGLQIIDLSQPDAPVLKGTLPLSTG